jgi:hypothetical protein
MRSVPSNMTAPIKDTGETLPLVVMNRLFRM